MRKDKFASTVIHRLILQDLGLTNSMSVDGRQVKIGVFIPTFAGAGGVHHDAPYYQRIDWPLTVDFAQTLERLGYDSLWICDHLMFGKDHGIFESWTSLSYMAAATRQITLGTFLICNSYRNPALVAKMSSTLDVASGGRLYLGMGAGWHVSEYNAYGYRFPPVSERIESLREAIRIIKMMWTQEETTYVGRFHSVSAAKAVPKPTQKPHPPIMIGAFGKKMLRLTAEVADAWNISDDPSPEIFKEKSELIDQHCLEIGRDPKTIERTWSGHVIIGEDSGSVKKRIQDLKQVMSGASMQLPSGELVKVDPDYLIERSIHGTPSECISQVIRLIDAGTDHFILYFWDFPDKHDVSLFASTVAPKVRMNQKSRMK
jgi:alkanesulfonate monooxygenase SsuD/methylene tetrahydromethanopterin reductase-like flavin-dependent oxidoreductase (luciferase family)